MIKVDLNAESKICRYLDLPKFLDFIHFNRLYFRQVDLYDDVMEGCFPSADYNLARGIANEDDNGTKTSGTEELIKAINFIRKSSYVSCWTLSEVENMGLWSVYGGKNGIAIQTKVSILERELQQLVNSPAEQNNYCLRCIRAGLINLKVSEITYIDHHSNDFRTLDFNPIWHKNMGYLYENEVRFLYSGTRLYYEEEQLHGRFGDGFHVTVYAKKIIEKIIISPHADQWFFDLVKGILEKYGLENCISWSNLRNPPHKS